MKENLLIKGLIRMFKGFIILLLLLILIIIIYLIPAWLPVKYAKTEKDFYKYENAILIKRTFYATGASWNRWMVGNIGRRGVNILRHIN